MTSPRDAAVVPHGGATEPSHLSRFGHQGTRPRRSRKTPGSASATQACTTASAPSCTVWVPRCPLKSVAVYPGSTACTRTPLRALAYMLVIMFNAALEDG